MKIHIFFLSLSTIKLKYYTLIQGM